MVNHIEVPTGFPDRNPHPVVTMRAEGEISYANKAGKRILLASGSAECAPDAWCEAASLALASNETVEIEWTSNQQVFSLLVVPAAVEQVNVYGVEITSRVATARSLRNSEEQLRSLIKSLDDMVFTIDLEGRLQFFHNALENVQSLFVAQPERFKGRLVTEIFQEELAAKLLKAMEVLRKTSATQEFGYHSDADAELPYFEVFVTPLVDSDGQLEGCTVVLGDETSAMVGRLRDERLYQLEQVLRNVATIFLQSEAADEAISVALELVGEFLDVSRAYVFHFRENERLLDNTHEWCAPGVEPEIDNLKGLLFDEMVPSWLPMLADEGIIAPVHIRELPEDVQAILEPQGIKTLLVLPFYVDKRLQGFIGLDETRRERKWLPEEVSAVRLVATSYSRVLSRQSSEHALAQAHEEALRSLTIRTNFVSNISHEIRTPLTGVLGMLELLLETDLDEDQREFVADGQLSAQSLLRVLDDILDFSRLEARKVELESSSVDLRGIVREVVGAVEAKARAKSLRVHSEISEVVPVRVVGDATRIRQVLSNLVDNAVKFTASGDVRIVMEQVSSAKGKSRLLFSVSDTGIGMTQEQLAKVFDSFVQLDASVTRKAGGTGLGLAITHQLIELMGGELTVVSEPGAGSTIKFALTLPVASDFTEQHPQEHLSRLKVLLADPNKTARYVFSQQLGLIGVALDEEEDVANVGGRLEDALRRGEPYDVLFYHMRGETDQEEHAVIRALRDRLGDAAPSIVRIYHVDTQVHNSDDLFDAVILRPIRQEHLVNLLENAFQARHG